MKFNICLRIFKIQPALLTAFVMVQFLIPPSLASNLSTQPERQSIFRAPTLLVCGLDSTTIRCPPRMYIEPLSASLSKQNKPSTDPDYISPTCQRNFKSELRKQSTQLREESYTECLKEKTLLKQLKQLCEGRRSCQISTMHLLPNSTACSSISDPLLVQYKCLPDHDSTMGEVICADTYMEVKCETQPTLNVLVILGARMDKEIKPTTSFPNGCPAIAHEFPNDASEKLCSSRIDITEQMNSLCDGRTSCSVNPNTVNQKGQLGQKCGKMHLSLIYVCVPPEVIRTRNYVNPENDSSTKKQKPNQRQTKELPHNIEPPQLIPEVQVAQHEPLITTTRSHIQLQVTSSSLPSSALIGFGTGFCCLFFILFITILVCRRSRRSKTSANQSLQQQEEKPYKLGQKELMPLCFAHSNAWATTNLGCVSTLTQPSELGYPCPNCKHSHDTYSNNKVESYHTADLVRGGCHCNDTMQPNLTGPNPLDTTYCFGSSSANQSCVLSVPGGTISGTIYAPASAFGGCMYGTPLDLHGDLNMNSGHSLSSLQNSNSAGQIMFQPTSLTDFPHSCHSPMNVHPKPDQPVCNNRGEAVYYGMGTIKTGSLTGSSSGRGCDGGSGTASDKVEENGYKFNHFVGLSKSDKREDYEIMTDTCSFDQNRCNSQYCTTHSDSKSTNCSYPVHVNLHSAEDNGQVQQHGSTTYSPKYIVPHLAAPELNMLTKSVIEESQNQMNNPDKLRLFKILNQKLDSPSKLKTLDKQDPIHCGSLESFSIPVLEPPSSFRTPNQTAHLKSNASDPDKNNCNLGSRFSKQSGRPPDLIMKSDLVCTTAIDYLEDVEQPPPQMAPLNRIAQVRNERNVLY